MKLATAEANVTAGRRPPLSGGIRTVGAGAPDRCGRGEVDQWIVSRSGPARKPRARASASPPEVRIRMQSGQSGCIREPISIRHTVSVPQSAHPSGEVGRAAMARLAYLVRNPTGIEHGWPESDGRRPRPAVRGRRRVWPRHDRLHESRSVFALTHRRRTEIPRHSRSQPVACDRVRGSVRSSASGRSLPRGRT